MSDSGDLGPTPLRMRPTQSRDLGDSGDLGLTPLHIRPTKGATDVRHSLFGVLAMEM